MIMKRYFALLLLVFLAAGARAQSLTLSDIANLASLDGSQAHTSLTFEKPFRELYSEEANGFVIAHYQGTTPASKSETIIIGYGVKNSAGNILHNVTYTSTNVNYVLRLITEAKSAGLVKLFQGADADKNIYLFNSYLYTVNIYINNDNSRGSVEIKQNDVSE